MRQTDLRPLLVPLLIFVVAIAAVFVYRARYQASLANLYTSKTFGIEFEYPSGYVLEESDEPAGERSAHHIVLMRESDLPLPVAGEGPPAISIDLYKNDVAKDTTESWIRLSRFSNFKLGEGRLATTTISGKPALSYRWSGLYEGTTIAVARERWVYAFSVTYMQPGDDIVQDFVGIRDTLRFLE